MNVCGGRSRLGLASLRVSRRAKPFLITDACVCKVVCNRQRQPFFFFLSSFYLSSFGFYYVHRAESVTAEHDAKRERKKDKMVSLAMNASPFVGV